MEEALWDVEVQVFAGCRRLQFAGLHPTNTTVADLRRMICEREGLQRRPDSFLLVLLLPDQQQPAALDDLCALAHYASLLRLEERATNAEGGTGRPKVRFQLQWLPRCGFFRIPPPEQRRLQKGSRIRVRRELQLLLGERQWQQTPRVAVSVEGLHLWEVDAATMSHIVFLVEAPDSSLYQVRMSLPYEYPFQKPNMQMFRQQLLVTDYAHLRATCLPVAPLEEALDRWAADGAGQARKATAMTALFAMERDAERAKRQFAAVHPQYQREVSTLRVLASRASNNDLRSSNQEEEEETTLNSLPCELVAMIASWLVLAHMTDERAASLAVAQAEEVGGQPVMVGQFQLPWDWPTKKIVTAPPEDNGSLPTL